MKHDRIYQYGMLRVMMLVVVWCVAVMSGIAGNVYRLEDGDEVDAGGSSDSIVQVKNGEQISFFNKADTVCVKIGDNKINVEVRYFIYYTIDGYDFTRFNVAFVVLPLGENGNYFTYKGKKYHLDHEGFGYKYKRLKGPIYKLRDKILLMWEDRDKYPLYEYLTTIDLKLDIDIREQTEDTPLRLRYGKSKNRTLCYKYLKIKKKHDEGRKQLEYSDF